MLLASDDDIIVAPLAVFGIFVMPALVWMAFRYMQHRERMAMIARGMQPPGHRIPTAPAAPYATTNSRRTRSDDETPQRSLRKGITLAFIGTALTIGLSFIGYDFPEQVGMNIGGPTIHPGPWLLGGLIPLFVGLSQIAIGVLSGAGFSRPGMQQPFAPPPFDMPPPPGGARMPGEPTFDTSYTYRPGVTPEIRPPSRPPERL